MKKIIAAICILLMLPFMMIPASATPPEQWSVEGKPAVGIVGLDNDSPAVLEMHSLTFDIQEYPLDHIDYVQGNFNPDKSRVKVKYQIYNPTDEEITVRLALPFTTGYYKYINAELGDYTVSVNDSVIDPDIRHSYHYPNSEFDADEDTLRLSDDYITNETVNPDTKVTKYTFWAYFDEFGYNNIARAGTYIYPQKGTYLYLVGGESINQGIIYKLHTNVGVDPLFELYVIGEDIAIPRWTIYKNPKVSNSEKLEGGVDLLKTEEMTFRDFVFQDYNESSGISEMDWYNAHMYYINNAAAREIPTVSFFEGYGTFEKTDYFMPWYRWDITLAPGERATTEANLPIHPEVEFRYEPQVLKYHYVLPSLHSWCSGIEPQITVNTPLYLIETSTGEMQKAEGGYTVTNTDTGGYNSFDGFYFRLSESENPNLQSSSGSFGGITEKNSILKTILNIILYPFKLIYLAIYRLIELFN